MANNLEGRTAPIQAIYSNERSTEEQNVRVNFNEQLTNGTNINYEPLNNGNEKHPYVLDGAFLHLIKYIIGSGILALPYCLFKVGYLIGIVGITVICLLYLHVVHIFLSVEYELCKRFQKPNLTYLEVVQKSFDVGPVYVRKLKSTFSFLICFTYVFNGTLFNATYLLIISEIIKKSFDVNCQTNIPLTYYLTGFIIVLNILCLRPKWNFLVGFLRFLHVLTFTVLFYTSMSFAKEDGRQLESVNDLFYVPQFFGIVLGAITCTGILSPVKNEMEKPNNFRPNLYIFIILITIVYIVFAIRAYFMYGQFSQENILLNLPIERSNETRPITLALNMYMIMLIVLFIMNLYLIFDIIWTNYLADKLKENTTSKRAYIIAYFVRSSLNLGAYVIAVFIPNLETILSLSGSFCIFTGICLPPIMQIFVSWSDEKFFTGTTLKNIAIVLIAFCSFVFAFVNSVIDIVALYILTL